MIFAGGKTILMKIVENDIQNGTCEIPQGVNAIVSWAFRSSQKLTHINFPEGVKIIADYALARCSMLTTVYLPKGLEKIGRNVFVNCDSLQTILITADNNEVERIKALLPANLHGKVIQNPIYNDALVHNQSLYKQTRLYDPVDGLHLRTYAFLLQQMSLPLPVIINIASFELAVHHKFMQALKAFKTPTTATELQQYIIDSSKLIHVSINDGVTLVDQVNLDASLILAPERCSAKLRAYSAIIEKQYQNQLTHIEEQSIKQQSPSSFFSATKELTSSIKAKLTTLTKAIDCLDNGANVKFTTKETEYLTTGVLGACLNQYGITLLQDNEHASMVCC